MNWKQVGIFSLILFFVLVTSGIPFGLVVFIAMVVKYPVKPYVHAFYISIFVTIVSTIFELIIIQHIVFTVFIINTVLLLLALLSGVFIGNYFSK